MSEVIFKKNGSRNFSKVLIINVELLVDKFSYQNFNYSKDADRIYIVNEIFYAEKVKLR